MRWVKEVFLYSMVAIGSVLLIPGIGQAEIYFGAMGGMSIPNDFSDVTSTGAFPDIPLPNADLGNAAMGGGKAGFFLPEYEWFGFETEGYFTDPEFSSFVDQGVDANLRVITWGFNAIVRYPGERFQPYVGAGFGLFFAEIDTDLAGPSLSDNWVPGFSFLGGFRGYVTDSIALFVEYKYNQAKFNLQTTAFNLPFGFEGTYSTNIIALGLAYHFR
jgi:hypothetical protein